ncbi:ketopantoate reductase family protein [Aquabacter spiritensis]|uniref:2-dehydropantoate 2-reductase n=1 Tax=Aquabacter spiritensis TaxID=933073 RepID=A0A4V2UWR3_9HYPH|nr:2-dehydropantoate 2-reductase N-terminal domain-containing protein [Aquabacter spiritensis]TCT00598.1 ketopantoate reductase [Aquabacter spiritensis]
MTENEHGRPWAGAPVLVWGAGAIGATLGAHFVRAGRQVLFVDVNDAHLAAIRAGQLKIGGPVVQIQIGAPAVRPEAVDGIFPLILLAVRLPQTDAAMTELLPHLAPDGTVVSCQNGLGALDVARHAGIGRTIAASFFLPADFNGPGDVTYGARASLTLGALDPERGPPLDPVLAVFRDFDPDIHVSDDILGVVWTKMAYGALLGAAAMDDGLTAKFLSDPRLRPIAVAIAREVTDVARASGHPAQDAPWFAPNDLGSDDPLRQQACVDAVLARLKGSAKQHSGYYTQIIQGHAPELPVQFEPMLALAQRQGISVPVTRTMLALMDDLSAGRLSPEPATMERLLSAAR